jgi:hypothetical protein
MIPVTEPTLSVTNMYDVPARTMPSGSPCWSRMMMM